LTLRFLYFDSKRKNHAISHQDAETICRARVAAK
jgi:hypothetical protein